MQFWVNIKCFLKTFQTFLLLFISLPSHPTSKFTVPTFLIQFRAIFLWVVSSNIKPQSRKCTIGKVGGGTCLFQDDSHLCQSDKN